MSSDSSLSSLSSTSSASTSSTSETSSSSLSSSSSSSLSSSGQFGGNLYVVSDTTGLHIQAFRFRDVTYQVTILDVNGASLPIDATNVVRVKIGKAGVTPHLDIDNTAKSSRGSQLIHGNPFTLILSAAELRWAPGIYDVEIVVQDSATGGKVTSLKTGVFALHQSMGEAAI